MSEPETGEQQETAALPGEELKGQTFTEHLQDLRRSLVKSVIAVVIGFAACYAFSEQLFRMLMDPLVRTLPEESTLIFTSLPEAFFTYLKVSLVAGIFLASPYIFYQIWSFVSPGLYSSEKKYLFPIALLSAVFFVTGALFGYFVVFPFGFDFFMGFTTELIRPFPTLKEYLSFSIKLLFAFGLIFELPLFIFFLARMGLVTSSGLKKKRKYAITIAFIVSAVLTPPDMVTQAFMAGPVILLYELGVWVAKIFGRREKPASENPDDDQNSARGKKGEEDEKSAD
ncbi:MAG: twin-arginine translocase subunit TatC [Desulfonatronovibrionaceae bacterium]